MNQDERIAELERKLAQAQAELKQSRTLSSYHTMMLRELFTEEERNDPTAPTLYDKVKANLDDLARLRSLIVWYEEGERETFLEENTECIDMGDLETFDKLTAWRKRKPNPRGPARREG